MSDSAVWYDIIGSKFDIDEFFDGDGMNIDYDLYRDDPSEKSVKAFRTLSMVATPNFIIVGRIINKYNKESEKKVDIGEIAEDEIFRISNLIERNFKIIDPEVHVWEISVTI